MISFESIDANNTQHRIMYQQMMSKFRQDYLASNDVTYVSSSNNYASTLSQKTKLSFYFVKVNDQYAGLCELSLIKHPETLKTIAYVSEVIYIDKQFRNNNIATEVRKQMRTYKQTTENLDVIGSKVSIQRVKRKKKYFVDQQFKYMYNICEDFANMRCQTDHDQAMCLLTYEMLDAPYVAMFPFKVRMSHAMCVVDKYRTFYRKFSDKHRHKFVDISSQEFQTYVSEVYLK